MSTTSTTNPVDVADRLQTHFSPKLLAHTVNELVLDQFAMKEDLPANAGSKTIRFFRKRAASRADVVALAEGTPITTFTEITMAHVDITLAQRGQATKITDILRAIDLYQPLKQGIETMGEDAALDFDTITRNAIIAGMLNSNGNFERFAGVTNTGNSANDFTTFNALVAANAKITRARALGCATQLKKSKVPMISGEYICIVAPEVMHDIRQDADWVGAAIRVNSGRALYKRETVSLDGVTYIEGNNSFMEANTYGTHSDAGTNYASLFLGRNAYGCPKLTGTTSPLRPQIIINDKPDKSDPLNQFVTAGWKAFYNAGVLNASFMVVLRSKSTFA